MNELVVGGTQQRIAGVFAIATAINEGLRVLDAKAHGKRLRLDINTATEKHLKGVAGTMSHGRDQMTGGKALSVGQHHPTDLTLLYIDIIYPALEADLPTQRSMSARIFSNMPTSL